MKKYVIFVILIAVAVLTVGCASKKEADDMNIVSLDGSRKTDEAGVPINDDNLDDQQALPQTTVQPAETIGGTIEKKSDTANKDTESMHDGVVLPPEISSDDVNASDNEGDEDTNDNVSSDSVIRDNMG